MPEIGEVARIVQYLRQHLVGRTLGTVTAVDDSNVFGKAGTSGTEFVKALTGKKVVGAGQQGKYFWLVMDSPPHPVFHFGMTGWWHIRGIPTYYYASKEASSAGVWPPKFTKFTLETSGSPQVETAFADARRFSRVRLLDCDGAAIRNTTPLKENGPDPVIDKELVTEEWLGALMRRKHVAVKALLLDQGNISGIGNWVGDEVLYNAKIHPEQYSDTLSASQIKELHKSIMDVCSTAVSTLADSSKFPEGWLFNYRWAKGKKDAAPTGPGGAKITFVTVGGRTSCVVPSVQKKTGPTAEDEEKSGKGKAVEKKDSPAKSKKRKVETSETVVTEEKTSNAKKSRRVTAVVQEEILNGSAKETNYKIKEEVPSGVEKIKESKSRKETLKITADVAVKSTRRRSARLSE